jgi:hypothetical protein
MRRKQAESLVAAEHEVQRIEAEYAEAMTDLSSEWTRYQETQAQNEMLRGELHSLRALVPGEVWCFEPCYASVSAKLKYAMWGSTYHALPCTFQLAFCHRIACLHGVG